MGIMCPWKTSKLPTQPQLSTYDFYSHAARVFLEMLSSISFRTWKLVIQIKDFMPRSLRASGAFLLQDSLKGGTSLQLKASQSCHFSKKALVTSQQLVLGQVEHILALEFLKEPFDFFFLRQAGLKLTMSIVVAKAGFELLISCLYLSRAGVPNTPLRCALPTFSFSKGSYL